jgi:hypothetical protein
MLGVVGGLDSADRFGWLEIAERAHLHHGSSRASEKRLIAGSGSRFAAPSARPQAGHEPLSLPCATAPARAVRGKCRYQHILALREQGSRSLAMGGQDVWRDFPRRKSESFCASQHRPS